MKFLRASLNVHILTQANQITFPAQEHNSWGFGLRVGFSKTIAKWPLQMPHRMRKVRQQRLYSKVEPSRCNNSNSASMSPRLEQYWSLYWNYCALSCAAVARVGRRGLRWGRWYHNAGSPNSLSWSLLLLFSIACPLKATAFSQRRTFLSSIFPELQGWATERKICVSL